MRPYCNKKLKSHMSIWRFQARNWKSVCTFEIKYDLPEHLWWFLWYLPKSGPIASHGLAGFLGSRANPAGSRLRGKYLYQIVWLTSPNCKSWVFNNKNHYFDFCPIDTESKNGCNFRVTSKLFETSMFRLWGTFYQNSARIQIWI